MEVFLNLYNKNLMKFNIFLNLYYQCLITKICYFKIYYGQILVNKKAISRIKKEVGARVETSAP